MSGLLIMILIISAMSLASYVYCWRDIMQGNPHIISLRQITCIMDRNMLDMIFGKHEAGYRYLLSPYSRKWFRTQWGFYYLRETAADWLCIIGALYFWFIPDHPLTLSFVLLAVCCQGINITQSVLLVRRWRHQILEELDEGSGL
ncbi:MAG: hypothetical protein LW823_01490 [Rickettsiales bacterium]|jgi:hypothetical protein|nr:hypothetical protein [Rickettsiales bacterium]